MKTTMLFTDERVLFKHIGRNLNALRKKHQITIDELQDNIGVSTQTISSIVYGRRLKTMPLIPLIKCCRTFSITIDDLINNYYYDV